MYIYCYWLDFNPRKFRLYNETSSQHFSHPSVNQREKVDIYTDNYLPKTKIALRPEGK